MTTQKRRHRDDCALVTGRCTCNGPHGYRDVACDFHGVKPVECTCPTPLKVSEGEYW